MENNIAYLAEPTELHESGVIKGKSLRCYEVTYETVQSVPNRSGYSYTRTNFVPTGKMFVYDTKKQTIVEKKTKAKLAGKSLGWNHDGTVCSSIKQMDGWRSTLYKTPKLAIAAKVYRLKTTQKERLAQYNNYIKTMEENLKPYDNYYNILQDEHPEYFI